MAKSDITIIFLTVNKLPEKWVAYHRRVLFEAIGGYPIITSSRIVMPDMPGINIIQEKEPNPSSIYEQMLKAAYLAETDYVAIAEDDTLYHWDHFHRHRPPSDRFFYDMSRWGLNTWGEPTYHYKDRISNSTMIAPKRLLIEALQERFNRFPDGIPDKPGMIGELGKPRVEKNLKVQRRKIGLFWSPIAAINFHHTNSIDERENRMIKRMGLLRAFDIPGWGRADELVKKFI